MKDSARQSVPTEANAFQCKAMERLVQTIDLFLDEDDDTPAEEAYEQAKSKRLSYAGDVVSLHLQA